MYQPNANIQGIKLFPSQKKLIRQTKNFQLNIKVKTFQELEKETHKHIALIFN